MRRRLIKLALSATITLAITFTFNCSSGDGDDGGGLSGTSGTFKDDRDSKSYKWVKIGEQYWMAENLNYNANGSKCYNDDPNCAKYGRLFNWATAMALPSNCNSKSCASQISEKHRGICPSGWHIPSSREWAVLIDYIETQECGCESTYSCDECAVTHLKATDGWNSLVRDEERDSTRADWWTTYENDADYAEGWNIKWDIFNRRWNGFFGEPDKDSLLSVRCLQDNSKDDMSSSLSDLPFTFDDVPLAMPFNMDWFTEDPTNGACSSCSPLPNNGGFTNINQIWDPERGEMVPALSTTTTVHGFGKKGTPIPPQRAGELILTALPNASGTVNTIDGRVPYDEWSRWYYGESFFGLPPEISDYGPYGIADPKKQAKYGGYTFVKNGFPNESSVGTNGQIAPTRCIANISNPSDINDQFKLRDEIRINCFNFSMLEIQPFQITVTIYDQRGNFVTEYRETVTEKEFRSVVQGPNYADEEQADIKKLSRNADKNCEIPTSSNYGQKNVLTTNGLVYVNVNIYPFSVKGEPLNGIYTVKIDRVSLPYDGCMNNNGVPVYVSEDYRHDHAEFRFGWRSR